ncbi:CRIB domain-containing protein RIC4 [Linum perenne]
MRAGRRMERLVLLPFSIGCVSESSIAIANHRSRSSSSNPLTNKNNLNSHPPSTIRRRLEQDDDESLSSTDDVSSTISSPAAATASKLPANISAGFHRFLKSFKSTFVNNEEEETEEDEGIMEIGLPTDVKHVTHIGFDDHEAISSSSSSSSSLSQLIGSVDHHRSSILCQCGGWENLTGTQPHHHRQLLCLHHSSSSSASIPLVATAEDPVITSITAESSSSTVTY